MVYGYYYKRLKTKNLPTETCPNCDVEGQMTLESGCRVHHGIFIPLWANKKCVFLSCKVCKNNYAISEYPHLSDQAESMYKKTRCHWYYYIGTIFAFIIFFSIATLIFSEEKDHKKELSSQIENIREGNVIYYKLSDKKRTSMRVDKVVNDTVFVRENKLSTNKNVSTIDKRHNYTDKQTFYLKSTLIEMHEKNKIIKIYQIIRLNDDNI